VAHHYRRVDLSSAGWRLDGVIVAVTHRERLVGMAGARRPLLVRTRSVHTLTMPSPIRITIIDGDGSVLSSRILERRRVMFQRSARWILETIPSVPPPPIGGVLRVAVSVDMG
jgi:hypothetical protein